MKRNIDKTFHFEFNSDKINEEINTRIYNIDNAKKQIQNAENNYNVLNEKIKSRKKELDREKIKVENDLSEMETNIQFNYEDIFTNMIYKDNLISTDNEIMVSINLLREMLQGKTFDVNRIEKEVEERQSKVNGILSKLDKEEFNKYRQLEGCDISGFDTETSKGIIKINEECDKFKNRNFNDHMREIEISIKNMKYFDNLNKEEEEEILTNIIDTNYNSNLNRMERAHDDEMLLQNEKDNLLSNKIELQLQEVIFNIDKVFSNKINNKSKSLIIPTNTNVGNRDREKKHVNNTNLENILKSYNIQTNRNSTKMRYSLDKFNGSSISASVTTNTNVVIKKKSSSLSKSSKEQIINKDIIMNVNRPPSKRIKSSTRSTPERLSYNDNHKISEILKINIKPTSGVSRNNIRLLQDDNSLIRMSTIKNKSQITPLKNLLVMNEVLLTSENLPVSSVMHLTTVGEDFNNTNSNLTSSPFKSIFFTNNRNKLILKSKIFN